MQAPNYDELRASAVAGERERFRNALEELVRKSGEHAVVDGVAGIGLEHERAIDWLVEIMCEQRSGTALGRAAFFSVFSAGPAAFPALRNAWDCGLEPVTLHMCMMDILVNTVNNPHKREQMRPFAQQEIPRWLEFLKSDQVRFRIWAIMLLPGLVRCAPDCGDEVRRCMTPLTGDKDETVRDLANRVLENLDKSSA
jgi:hypothetical protein